MSEGGIAGIGTPFRASGCEANCCKEPWGAFGGGSTQYGKRGQGKILGNWENGTLTLPGRLKAGLYSSGRLKGKEKESKTSSLSSMNLGERGGER